MQPLAYVFVVFSTKEGAGSCALLCEYGSDEDAAYKAVRERLLPKDILIYSSYPIYDKHSLEWDFFVRFIQDQNGELVDGLRFCKKAPGTLIWELMEYSGDRIVEHCYLKSYGVVASCEVSGCEYVAVFDWYDEDIDAACLSVAKYLPRTAKLCGVFNGTTSTTCQVFMGKHWNYNAIKIGAIDFVRMKAVDAIKEFCDSILDYNYMECGELKERLFIDCRDDRY